MTTALAITQQLEQEPSNLKERLAIQEARIERALASRQHRQQRVGVSKSDPRPHVVYICRDGRSRVLYVGITLSLSGRFSAHSRTSWFRRVSRIDIEHFPDRASALSREAVLISEHRPPINRAGVSK